MREGGWLVAFLIVQRLAELGLAQWNTVRLRAAGGVEFGAAHYPLLVGLHASWLLGLWIFGHGRSVDPAGLAAFVLLQGARVWVIASLGQRWTTRRDRTAKRELGCARALSLVAASELCGRRF